MSNAEDRALLTREVERGRKRRTVGKVADLVGRFGGEPPDSFWLRGRAYRRQPPYQVGALDGAMRCKGRAAGWPGFVLYTCDEAAPSVRYVTVLYGLAARPGRVRHGRRVWTPAHGGAAGA